MWNLIGNNLKIFIDPLVFANLKNIDKRISLTNTLQDYFTNIDPCLCFVTLYYPKYAESTLGMKRTFLTYEKIEFIEESPKSVISVFPIDPSLEQTDLGKAGKILNEFFSLAICNKCVFYLTESEFAKEKKVEIDKNFGIQVINIDELFGKVEAYLQGFYNYFKFHQPIYGVISSDIAYSFSDNFYKNTLVYLESEISNNQQSEESKERIRSFIHNRYIDILTTIDQIEFFKLQQRIYNVEHGLINNNMPHLNGRIRYYINYYLLLWGAIDHLTWIINDIFSFGYDPNVSKDRKNVGLNKNKKEFLAKIENQNKDLYNFIVSDEFQDWMFFFSQLRHKNAHREMFSASPLLLSTDESEISEEEIDKIIYKDSPPVPKEVEDLMPLSFIESKKNTDRLKYKISKMKKGLDHVAVIKKDDKQFIFDPISRIPIDMKNLREFISKIFDAYKIKLNINKN